MKTTTRSTLASSCLIALASLLGCGGETVTDPGPGGGTVIPSGPLNVFQVAVRPQALERASSLAGGTPNPVGATYFVTAFFTGGGSGMTFDWNVPSELGQLQPNTNELSVNSATVTLLNDGRTPLGFYDISVSGAVGPDTSFATGRFAVGEANWMKHNRINITDPNNPPRSLVSYPMYAPNPDGTDEIFYVTWPNDDAVNIFTLQADAPLDQTGLAPRNNWFIPPGSVPSQQAAVAPDLAPSLSPPGLQRDEILFSSHMDIEADARQVTVGPRTPFNLWVVSRNIGDIQFFARPMTFDSTFAATGGLFRYYSFDYLVPRWDPSPTQPVQDARIGFLAALDGTGTNVWLADMRDGNMDTVSDTLVNYRRVTDIGSVTSFDWHPNGEYIYYTTGLERRSVVRLHIDSGTEDLITFTSQDSLLEGPNSVSVFADTETLLAFEATSENLVHLYVYNEDAGTLTRVNRYAYSIAHRLYPRWHPNRREIVFVSDYGVAAWADGNDPTPVGNPSFAGRRRTTLPSVWTLRLAERP